MDTVFMNTDRAARYLGIERHRLVIRKSRDRLGIPVVKLNRLVRFRRQDLDAWLTQRRANGSVSTARARSESN